ncbi:MAG: TolC family outer membrane protein [Gammaproteobacteria bacterium]|nr:TolC family outer membrane protein [Gammaproteobacteria bacterium]
MYKLLLTLCLILASPSLFAQDLIDVYNQALQQDAQLRIAESEYLAATEALPVASSAYLPQVNFSANVTSSDSDSGSTGDDGTTDSYGYTLSLFQNIYNAETIALVDIAEAQVAKAEADLAVSRQDLIIRVAERYFGILASEDNLELAIAEKNAIGRQLEQAQKRFEVGLIAITDVHEAQARYDSAVAQQLLAKNLLDNASQALQVIIAETPDLQLAQLGDELELGIPAPEDSRLWVEVALKNNNGLVSSLATLNVAKYTRAQLASSDTPTLDFTASYTDTSIESDISGEYDQEDLALQIELNVPLYTGGRISAQKQQAESEYQAAKDATLLQQRLTSQQTRDAYLGVVSGISQVKALRQALSSSTTALEATEAGFEVGTRTSVDVLVSLRETYAARRDYASSRYDYLINILRLKQASGLLNVDDLLEINLWLIQ